MKLVLEIDERLVHFVVELHPTEHCAHNERSNFLSGRLHIHDEALFRLNDGVGRRSFEPLEDSQSPRNPFDA